MTDRRWLWWLGFGVAAIAVAHWLDWWAYDVFRYPAANDRDWGRFLRSIGFLPTWLAIGLALWLQARVAGANRAELSRAARAVVLGAVLGGIAAEVIKLLVRRVRPDGEIHQYVFRSFADQPFKTGDLGFPSSHAMVAFGGAAALSRRYPKVGPVVIGLAIGCGLTRLFAQAHFLSDVVAGAVGGSWIGWMVGGRRWAKDDRR